VGSGRAWDGPLTSVLAAPGAVLSWLVAGEGLTGTGIWAAGGAAGAGFAAGSARDGSSIGALAGATGTSREVLASGAVEPRAAMLAASRAEAEQRAVTQDSN